MELHGAGEYILPIRAKTFDSEATRARKQGRDQKPGKKRTIKGHTTTNTPEFRETALSRVSRRPRTHTP